MEGGLPGRLSAYADRLNRTEKMSPKGDMRRNALRPEFIQCAFTHEIAIH